MEIKAQINDTQVKKDDEKVNAGRTTITKEDIAQIVVVGKYQLIN